MPRKLFFKYIYKTCKICEKVKPVKEMTQDTFTCKKCNNIKGRLRASRYYEKLGEGYVPQVRPKPSEICNICGADNDRYPKAGFCKKCYNAKYRSRYKDYGRNRITHEPWTFSYWRYCLECKEILPIKDFDSDNKLCKECSEPFCVY